MSNEIERIAGDIGHGLDVAAKDVAHIVGIVDKTDKVLHTVLGDEAQLKDVLIAEVKSSVALASKVDECVVEKGLNLADDEALLAEVQSYFAGLKANLFPVIEKVYGEIVADVKAAA